MKPPRTPSEVQRIADLMQRELDIFRRDAARFHRAAYDAQPGYPTSTIGDGGSGGDVSRPTERFALEGNPAAQDLKDWYLAWGHACGWLAEIGHIRSRYLPAMAAVKLCSNPRGCPGHREAAQDRGGYCQPCWRTLGPEGRKEKAA